MNFETFDDVIPISIEIDLIESALYSSESLFFDSLNITLMNNKRLNYPSIDTESETAL